MLFKSNDSLLLHLLVDSNSPPVNPCRYNGRPLAAFSWNARYGDHDKYRKHCAIAHRKTLSTCVVCLKTKSEQIHHAMYGNDRIGVTTFPVCSHCHENICHSKENWIKSRSDPVWNNRNTPEFIKRLKLGYQLLYGGINV